jgi:hypothetical protein
VFPAAIAQLADEHPDYQLPFDEIQELLEKHMDTGAIFVFAICYY